jgi:hypothetical protein
LGTTQESEVIAARVHDRRRRAYANAQVQAQENPRKIPNAVSRNIFRIRKLLRQKKAGVSRLFFVTKVATN